MLKRFYSKEEQKNINLFYFSPIISITYLIFTVLSKNFTLLNLLWKNFLSGIIKILNLREEMNYHNITKDDMLNLWDQGELVEKVEYMGNIYGFTRAQVENNKTAVVIPDGFRQLLEKPDLDITSFYLDVSPEIRKSRYRL